MTNANLKNWTMKAGDGSEAIAGYVFQTTYRGHTSRTWMTGLSQESAFKTAARMQGLDWCRAFAIINDQRVVLA